MFQDVPKLERYLLEKVTQHVAMHDHHTAEARRKGPHKRYISCFAMDRIAALTISITGGSSCHSNVVDWVMSDFPCVSRP